MLVSCAWYLSIVLQLRLTIHIRFAGVLSILLVVRMDRSPFMCSRKCSVVHRAAGCGLWHTRVENLSRLQTIISKLGGIVFTISSGLIAGKVISTHLLRYHFTGLCFLRFGIHFGTGGAFCMTGRSICTWRRDCWERN